MSDYVVTPRAQADLERIYDYSLVTWGEAQALRYLQQLVSRFAWIAENPAEGRARDEIAEGYRCCRQGAHIVFYVQKASDVYIIGIPHAAMDINAYFDE